MMLFTRCCTYCTSPYQDTPQVTTRNFINVSMRSEGLGANLRMTRTYNRLSVVWPNGSHTQVHLGDLLTPRQIGYMPYTAPMLVQFARHVVMSTAGHKYKV